MKLAALFSDHMVLQRDIAIPVWGWAEPDSHVTVELAGNCARATAGVDGKWLARLPALPPGGPHTLTARIHDGVLQVVTDVLVGEVWLCSGQSNMEFPLSGVKNAKEEVAAAGHPNIRLFEVPKSVEVNPRSDTTSQWEICTPDSAKNFSAVAYFHGVELQRRLGVPVGLINASWGGTTAESWTSREGLLAEPTLHDIVVDCDHVYPGDEIRVAETLRNIAHWEQIYLKRPTPPNLGFEQGWANPEVDREEWNSIEVPGPWQRAGLNFNGVVWFRRELDIPSSWEGRDLTLSLGACDKSEWTYFNGEFIGSLTLQEGADAWSTPRVYTVPGRLVKAGRNLVAVRVFSHLHLGGMTGPASLLFTRLAVAPEAGVISLKGTWIYRVEHNFGIIPPVPLPPPSPDNASLPWVLYAGMIAPLVPYTVRGAIWYQGESNAPRAYQYRTLFPALIRDWRQRWGQEHFHFHFVQLANFANHMAPSEQPGESRWAELREAQTRTLALPDTAMAVTIDVGDETDIHPTNKQDVGRRLAWSALSNIHGLEDVTPSGPLYKACKVEGSQMRLYFEHLGGALEARGGALKAFAIAGADKRFLWADARIEGDTVVVSSPDVSDPVAVRYGWADYPLCNLYNRAGLPASPFRTDDWPAR
ncbi:MAG: sialate O-acetylesterase [Phycisphaerae bacterium]|jgi:sialate O-acetylesterase